jgi:hypothetical protein
VSYSVSANTGVQRTGTLAIAGQTFTVTDNGPCSWAISPTSRSHPTSGGTGSVGVTSGTGCTWTAVSNVPSWVTITSGGSGSGNGTVNYSVAANTGQQRTGTLTLGGQTFTVTQSAAPETISTPSLSGPSGGGIPVGTYPYTASGSVSNFGHAVQYHLSYAHNRPPERWPRSVDVVQG